MSKKIGKPSTALPSTRLPTADRGSSYLIDETFLMEQQRRQEEQQGQRRFARVNAREHKEPLQSAPEGELQNSIKQHPYLDNQRNAGVDPNLNPEPALNTEARREYDKAKAEQQLQHKMRLGLMPNIRSAPEPKP